MCDDDVSKVCRLCMEAMNLNYTMEDDATLKMVEDCLQMKFTFAPPFLPAEICADCYYKIKDFYEFQENCRSIQELLRQDVENFKSANMPATNQQQICKANARTSQELEPPVSIENRDTADHYDVVIDDPPIILNNSLVVPSNCSSLENSTECDRIGKVKCINFSLYPGRDKVIIINKEAHHECSVCHKSYRNQTRLQQHLLVHKKKRTYLCEYCSMSFRQNSSLQVHIRSHTKEKPFICPHCENAYGYYHLLKKHLSRYHASESS